MKTIKFFSSALIIVLFSVVGVCAQDHNKDHATNDKEKAQHHEPHNSNEKSHDNHENSLENAHGKSHHSHKNHVAINIGRSSNFTHKTTLMAIGADYEYRFSKKLGIGIGAEYLTNENTTEFIFAIPLFYHPVGGLKFVIAPLLMKSKHSGAHDDEHATETHDDEHATDTHGDGQTTETPAESEWSRDFGILVGVGYDFPIGNFTITPSLNTEIIGESTIIVPALSLGFGF